jgi:hypothetical protein
MDKMLRKTTRQMMKNLVQQPGVSVEDVAALLSGAGGASAKLVTLEPLKRKKMRYTFNTNLRQKRIADDLEDETDDEALEEEEKRAKASGARAGAGAGAGAGSASMEDDDDGEDGAGEYEEKAQRSGMYKNPDKPLPKREMTTEYYKWQNHDLANPGVPGLFDVQHKPSASRQRWQAAKKRAGKAKAGKKGGKGDGDFNMSM